MKKKTIDRDVPYTNSKRRRVETLKARAFELAKAKGLIRGKKEKESFT